MKKGISDTTVRKRDPEATIPTGQIRKEVIHKKGEFLTVRNTGDGFFLCQTARNVHDSEGGIHIHWLTQTEGNKQV